ncbi:MAG: hypothetical protein J7L08_03980 [Candidatus Aenigmarchaeota archaeon]|nr:hypothetical protein [Candidatus Aenigmarchaeota archaeon]
MISEGEVKDLVKKNWIKCWSMIEVMAVGKDVTEEALKKHIEKIKKEKGIKIYKENFEKAVKIGKQIEKKDIFTQVVELEFVIENLRKLSDFVIVYGPSALEILEPEKIQIDMNEAQEMLNRIATLLHSFTTAKLQNNLIPK